MVAPILGGYPQWEWSTEWARACGKHGMEASIGKGGQRSMPTWQSDGATGIGSLPSIVVWLESKLASKYVR